MKHRQIEYVLSSGYGGHTQTYLDEALAREAYAREVLVPSYVNPMLMQPVELMKITTIGALLETNR